MKTVSTYERMLPLVEATIFMPPRSMTPKDFQPIEVNLSKLVLPFPVIQFTESFDALTAKGDTFSGVEHMIVWDNNGRLDTCSKLVYNGVYRNGKMIVGTKGLTVFTPDHSGMRDAQQGILVLNDFNQIVRRRNHSFVEQPVSRQIRRYNGFSPTYSEYVIIHKDEPQYHLGISVRRLLPTLRRRHWISGHFRRFWKGVRLERPISVKKHERNIKSSDIGSVPKTYIVR